MLTRLLHIKLDVSDLRRSLSFYVGVLGCKEIARYDIPGSHTIVQVSPNGQPPGVELWFEPPHGARADDRVHVAWGTRDVTAAVDRLSRLGVTIERQPFTIGHEKLAFIRDPDGYLIELSEEQEQAGVQDA